jgi:hypothetical protein
LQQVSSTNKTDHHNITETLLKVALNTIKQTNKQSNKQTNNQTNPKFIMLIIYRTCRNAENDIQKKRKR